MDIEELLKELSDKNTTNIRKMNIIAELKSGWSSEQKDDDSTKAYISMRDNYQNLLKVINFDKNYEVRKGTIEILKNFIWIGDTEQITEFLFNVIERDENYEVKKAAVDILGVVVEGNLKDISYKVVCKLLYKIKVYNYYYTGAYNFIKITKDFKVNKDIKRIKELKDYMTNNEELRENIMMALEKYICCCPDLDFYVRLLSSVLSDSSPKVVSVGVRWIQKNAKHSPEVNDNLAEVLSRFFKTKSFSQQIAYIYGSVPYIDKAIDCLKSTDPKIIEGVLKGLKEVVSEDKDWKYKYRIIDELWDKRVQQNSDKGVRAEMAELIGLILNEKSPNSYQFAKRLISTDFVFLFDNITNDNLIKTIIEYIPVEDGTAIYVLGSKNMSKERTELILKRLYDNFTPGRLIGESLDRALKGKKYNEDNLHKLLIELMKAMYDSNRGIPDLIKSINSEKEKGVNGNYEKMITLFSNFLEEDGYIYKPKSLSKAGIVNFVNRCIAILFKLIGKEWKYEPRIVVKSDVEASKVKETIQKFNNERACKIKCVK